MIAQMMLEMRSKECLPVFGLNEKFMRELEQRLLEFRSEAVTQNIRQDYPMPVKQLQQLHHSYLFFSCLAVDLSTLDHCRNPLTRIQNQLLDWATMVVVDYGSRYISLSSTEQQKLLQLMDYLSSQQSKLMNPENEKCWIEGIDELKSELTKGREDEGKRQQLLETISGKAKLVLS